MMGATGIMKLPAVALVVFSGCAFSQESLSVGGKALLFGKRVLNPESFAKSAFTAGINQWANDPYEWGQGFDGYARRYGHKIANRGVENGIGFVTAAALREDPRYFPSTEAGVWRRTRHAIISTFLTRTDDGGRRISTWRFVGNYGSQFVSNTWRPPSDRGNLDALRRGSYSIGFDVASNVFKEFWPDIKQKLFRRR
jgi:hypothetical protein